MYFKRASVLMPECPFEVGFVHHVEVVVTQGIQAEKKNNIYANTCTLFNINQRTASCALAQGGEGRAGLRSVEVGL
jgi:hypothetical protein